MKNIFLLISMLLILGCSSKKYVFLNDEFKKELDDFLDEYKEEELSGDIVLVVIADAKHIFADYDYEKDKNKTYLAFYLSHPETCDGFSASFYYKKRNVMLYDYSDSLKLSQFIKIDSNKGNCTSEILIDYIDNPYQRWFLVKDNLELMRFSD